MPTARVIRSLVLRTGHLPLRYRSPLLLPLSRKIFVGSILSILGSLPSVLCWIIFVGSLLEFMNPFFQKKIFYSKRIIFLLLIFYDLSQQVELFE